MARWSRITSALMASQLGLDMDALSAVLLTAKADQARPMRELDEHLSAHPDALTSGDPRCPAVVIRLVHALAAVGCAEVTLPGCSDCGRTGVPLPRSGPAGRLCQACAARSPQNKKSCARCGRTARILARRDEGGICNSCYRTDPQVTENCANCGQLRMPATRQADGKPLCERCWTPPSHTCTACGRVGQARSVGSNGALCASCYRHLAQPRRLCGKCGRIRQIVRRATDRSPDLCGNCAVPPSAPCSTCGRVRPCTKGANGQMVCRACSPRAARVCSTCGHLRPVHAHWPRGAVCRPCCVRILDHPKECHRCHEHHPLIGSDEDEHEICGPCAGLPGIYICAACGKAGASTQRGNALAASCRPDSTSISLGPTGMSQTNSSR